MKLMHEGEELSLCNIYGPNVDNRVFFQDVGVRLWNVHSEAIIVGGDLNTVHSPVEDRRGNDRNLNLPSQSRPTDQVLPASLGLRDVWRDTHPEGRGFTFFLPCATLLV